PPTIAVNPPAIAANIPMRIKNRVSTRNGSTGLEFEPGAFIYRSPCLSNAFCLPASTSATSRTTPREDRDRKHSRPHIAERRIRGGWREQPHDFERKKRVLSPTRASPAIGR